ncbi:MAG: M23 family metallopeptidase [Rhodospirillales bacterium]|nr:M23 family metallopeptidase [Rhodospirillales bacterium]
MGVAAQTREPGVHWVRAGETVYTIARQNGIDAYRLITLNKLSAPFNLFEGQRLALTGSAVSTGETTTITAALPASSATAASDAVNLTPSTPDGAVPAARPVFTDRADEPPDHPVVAHSSMQVSPPASAGGFVWPVQGRILSEFGPKGGGRYNDGINIAARSGSAVRAADSGVVAYAGNELRGFGNVLLIKHAGGWMTAYAHNDAVLVARGERVQRGQVVARVGDSGNVDRPQLHFEIRKGKQAIDPLSQLPRPSAAATTRRDAG